MHPHRILSLLFLLLLSLALGACASHEARPAPEPGAPLPAVTLERGDRVFVTIENGKSMTEDLHSMLTAYLQSERGLNPAPDAGDADLVILVEIRDVWATSDGSRVSAGRTLGNVGTGTMLGVLLGGLVDGRGGAIVGAGIANADPMKTMFTAFKYAKALYILPILFYYRPALLLQSSLFDIALTFVTVMLGLIAFAAVWENYLMRRTTLLERLLLLGGALLLFIPGHIWDFAGIGLFIIVYCLQRYYCPAGFRQTA